MRKSRFRILRLLAMFAMIASVSGVFGLTASAAPANIGNTDRAQAQSLDVCLAAVDLGVIDEEGNLIDLVIDGQGLVDLLAEFGLVIDLPIALSILAGGCGEVLQEPAPGTITVTVTDAETTAGIPDATVGVAGETLTTGADGTATTAGEYEPGDYPFTASAAGYVTGDGVATVVDGPGSGAIALAPDVTEPVPGPITITVFDNVTTVGIPDATVEVAGETLMTGADGTATTAGEYEPGDYPFTASHPDYIGSGGIAVVTDEGVGTGSVGLTPSSPPGDPATITVYVFDAETNEPIEGATAEVAGETLTTDADGFATTTGEYGPGDFLITASADGYATNTGEALVADGEGYGEVGLTPEAPGTTAPITVTVTDADTGAGIEGATVSIAEEVLTTEADGTATTEGLYEQGEYEFTASAEGYVDGGGTAVVTDEGVGTGTVALTPEVTEPDPGSITVTVVDEADAPIEGATVSIIDADGVVEDGPTDADGVYVSSELPGGTYTAGASAPGYQPNSVSVEVDGNVEATVTLIEAADLDDGTITTTVTDADTTEPIADATVTIWDGAGLQVDSGTTGDDGVYVSDELVGGTYAVTASADGYLDGGNEDVVVDGDVVTDIALNPAGEEPTGTVTVFKYVCEELDSDGPVWGVEPGDDCAPGSATFVFTEVVDEGLGQSHSLDVDGEGSIDLPVGTYEVTENGFFSSTVIEVTEEGATLSVLNPVEETFPVTIVAETSDAGSAEGALVYIAGENGDVVQTFQAPPADGTLDAANSFTTDLPAGAYTVTIDGTDQGYAPGEATFTVPTDGDVVVTLQELIPTGDVTVQKVYCEDLDEVVFNPDGDLTECDPGAALFSFYQMDDGSDDFEQLQVWEDGFGIIELPVGTYVVVEEGTQAETEIVVAENETTSLTVANPGTAPAPRDGTVNISVFTCTNIDEVIFSSDSFFSTFALPTFEPACEPGAATLTFYLIGDGSGEPNGQIDVDGTGSITLAPGNYEVVEESTGASTLLTVNPGDFITLDVQIPAGGEVIPGSSVNIVKFYCDTVTEVEFLAYGMEDISDRDELPGAPDCVSGPATFTFYLVGDGTDDYAQLWVNGSGSIGLEPGMYVVVEEETQATFELEVLEGENTLLVVNNPMPDDGVPGPDPDDPDDPKDPKDPDKDKDKDTDGVTELPSTGHGSGGGNSVMLMMTASVMSMLAAAGAFVLRREQI